MSHSLKVVGESTKKMYGPRGILVCGFSADERKTIVKMFADKKFKHLPVVFSTREDRMELMKDMVSRFRASLVIVTHNLGVVARYAQRIYIMYAGRIVEEGTTKDIFKNPRHSYTVGLLKYIPRLDEEEGRKLVPIDGLPPNLIRMPKTCAFLPRCTSKIDICTKEPWPGLTPIAGDREHYIRCYLNKEK